MIDALHHAATHLARGGLVALPTETVWGLAADPADPTPLYAAKGRADGVPVQILVASLAAAQELAHFSPEAARLAEAHWPGPLTLIVPPREPARWHPALLGPGGGLGLRVPNHPTALALLAAYGPLAATSCNLSGQPPVASAEAARTLVPDAIILDGPAPAGLASTVVDCLGERLHLVRAGGVVLET